MTASTKIAIAGVTKQFDGAAGAPVKALENVDLHIADGEFVAILGPSGCGKSSLLNIIAGFEQSSSGRIEVDGKPINGPEPNRGVVFQEYALFPWLTVAGNIGFGPASRGFRTSEIEKLVARYVRLVGLQGFEQKYPHELSGGMRQRCALARCMANDPDIMLMDEPLAALDALTRVALQDELLRIWSEASRERKKTVVYVTHSIDEAIFLSDRIIVMTPRPGRIRGEFAVPFARPRLPEVRVHDDFHRLSDEIWLMLQAEMRR
jgi:NitT/TauT family transport system ATP-binding protein